MLHSTGASTSMRRSPWAEGRTCAHAPRSNSDRIGKVAVTTSRRISEGASLVMVWLAVVSHSRHTQRSDLRAGTEVNAARARACVYACVRSRCDSVGTLFVRAHRQQIGFFTWAVQNQPR